MLAARRLLEGVKISMCWLATRPSGRRFGAKWQHSRSSIILGSVQHSFDDDFLQQLPQLVERDGGTAKAWLKTKNLLGLCDSDCTAHWDLGLGPGIAPARWTVLATPAWILLLSFPR